MVWIRWAMQMQNVPYWSVFMGFHVCFYSIIDSHFWSNKSTVLWSHPPDAKKHPDAFLHQHWKILEAPMLPIANQWIKDSKRYFSKMRWWVRSFHPIWIKKHRVVASHASLRLDPASVFQLKAKVQLKALSWLRNDSETKDDSATKTGWFWNQNRWFCNQEWFWNQKKRFWNQGWFRNQGHLETKNGTAQQSSGVHFFSFRSIKAEVAQ